MEKPNPLVGLSMQGHTYDKSRRADGNPICSLWMGHKNVNGSINSNNVGAFGLPTELMPTKSKYFMTLKHKLDSDALFNGHISIYLHWANCLLLHMVRSNK